MGELTEEEYENPAFTRKTRSKRYNVPTKKWHNKDRACNGGCINPLQQWNCGNVEGQGPEYIHPLPTKSTDIRDEDIRRYQGSKSHGNNRIETASSDDREVPGCVNPLSSTNFGLSGISGLSTDGNKQQNQVVDGFFTLVDNLLVNKILNIVDEKVVDDMATRYGFA